MIVKNKPISCNNKLFSKYLAVGNNTQPYLTTVNNIDYILQ